jgi:hypothetical protein
MACGPILRQFPERSSRPRGRGVLLLWWLSGKGRGEWGSLLTSRCRGPGYSHACRGRALSTRGSPWSASGPIFSSLHLGRGPEQPGQNPATTAAMRGRAGSPALFPPPVGTSLHLAAVGNRPGRLPADRVRLLRGGLLDAAGDVGVVADGLPRVAHPLASASLAIDVALGFDPLLADLLGDVALIRLHVFGHPYARLGHGALLDYHLLLAQNDLVLVLG